MSRKEALVSSIASAAIAGAFVLGCFTDANAATVVPTSTLLSVRSSGSIVNKVPKQTHVQLVAQVQSPTAPLTTGQVRFCDASAPGCTDFHLLGVAQLTAAGTATLNIVPGVGARSYRAEFLGIANQYQESASSAESLTVNGKFPTTTTLAVSGAPGSYNLNASVVGNGSPAALTGSVSFVDLSANNAILGTAPIGSSVPGLKFAVAPNSINLPPSYALGDFNGDGVPDLAGVGPSNSVAILLGDGNGGFASTRGNIAVGYNVSTFAVGDFNGDGFQDVVATSYTDAKLIVLLGNGDGTFQAPAIYTGLQYTNTIVVGDFNRDGKADLATSNSGVSAVELYLGQGDGTFKKKSTPLAGAAVSLSVVDLNSDGIQDLIAAEGTTVEALLGGAGATFSSVSNTAVGSDPSQVIAGDFNGDAYPDVATVSPDEYSVSVLLGQGNGSFTAGPTVQFDFNTQPYALALTDLNQDGKEDIAVATLSTVQGTAYQSVLFGSGQGAFTTTAIPIPGTVYEGASEYSILSADVDGDGSPDLLVGPGVLLDKISQIAEANLSGTSISGSGTHSIQAVTYPSAPYKTSTSGTVQLQAQ
jgi:hypothetical protein